MRLLGLLVLLILAGTSTAAAQTAPASQPLAHAEISAGLGWANLRSPQTDSPGYPNNWINAIVSGEAGAGWYWTDHVEMRGEVFATSRAQQRRLSQVFTNDGWTIQTSVLHVRQTGTSLLVQYHFFHNVWAQPHVAVGVDVAHETTDEERDPITAFDPATRASRVVVGRQTVSGARWTATPFAQLGGKDYVTRRVFLSGDVRLGVRGGIAGVLLRGGVGVDF